jgi:hypothetical protein
MSKKPKKPKPSAQEQAAAKEAIYKNQRYDTTWRPLEQRAIKELTTANLAKRSEMLAGRSNADLEQGVQAARQSGLRMDVQSGRGYGSGNTVANANRNSVDLMGGKQNLLVRSDQKAQDSHDLDALNVVKTGQDMARSTGSALTQQARIANQSELTKWGNKISKDQAKADAMTDIASTAMIAGYGAYKKGTATQTGVTGDKEYSYGDSELGWGGRKMREWFPQNFNENLREVSVTAKKR